MSLYLHLETSPGQEMIRHRGKQDDFPACPFSFWAPPPRKKIHFAHESLSDVGRAGAGVWRPVISHSVLLRFHDRTFSGVERHGLFVRFSASGVPRQAFCGPGVQEAGIPVSLPAVWKFPSRIHRQYTVWDILMDSAITKVCFITKPLSAFQI